MFFSWLKKLFRDRSISIVLNIFSDTRVVVNEVASIIILFRSGNSHKPLLQVVNRKFEDNEIAMQEALKKFNEVNADADAFLPPQINPREVLSPDMVDVYDGHLYCWDEFVNPFTAANGSTVVSQQDSIVLPVWENFFAPLYNNDISVFLLTWQPTWFITSFTFFAFASLLFSAGFVGLFLNNRNFLLLLVKAELMFLGLNLWFIGFAIYNSNYLGYVYALLLFGLVAAESAIGLTLFLMFFLYKKTIMIDVFDYSPEEIRRFNQEKKQSAYWAQLGETQRQKYKELTS